MTQWRRYKRLGMFIGVMMVMALVFTGCSALKMTSKPMTAPTGESSNVKSTSIYKDFGDVLIPGKLKEDPKESFVIQTPGMIAGVMALNGRVAPAALAAFFQTNMTKDNWRAITSFKSKRTMMLYQKDNRWCVISITPKDFSTHVEIWVAPTSAEIVDSGLLK
jgi:hypothetical protein